MLFGIAQFDGAGGAQIEAADVAGVHEQYQYFVLRGAVLVGLLDYAGADDDARGVARTQLQFDARTLHLIEKRGERGAGAQLEGEIREALLQRVARIVAHAVHFSAVAVCNGKRLEDIVHVVGLEIQARGLAGLQFSGAFEVGHAMLIERHFGNGKIGGGEYWNEEPERPNAPKHFHNLLFLVDLTAASAKRQTRKSYCPFQSIGREKLALHRNLTPGAWIKFLGRMLGATLLVAAASTAVAQDSIV